MKVVELAMRQGKMAGLFRADDSFDVFPKYWYYYNTMLLACNSERNNGDGNREYS